MSKPQITITLGRSGQVVKRQGSISDSSQTDCTQSSGSKRSIKERLGTNVGSCSNRNQPKNKRQRGMSDKSSLSIDEVDGARVTEDDLRFKLICKRSSRTGSASGEHNMDLHAKLSRKVSGPMRNDIQRRMHEPNSTSHLQVHQRRPEPNSTRHLGKVHQRSPEPNSLSYSRQVQLRIPEPNSTSHLGEVHQRMPEPNSLSHSRQVQLRTPVPNSTSHSGEVHQRSPEPNSLSYSKQVQLRTPVPNSTSHSGEVHQRSPEPNSLGYSRQVQLRIPKLNSTSHLEEVHQRMPEPNSLANSRQVQLQSPVPNSTSHSGEVHQTQKMPEPNSTNHLRQVQLRMSEPNSTSHLSQVQQRMPEPTSNNHYRQVQQEILEPNITNHSRQVQQRMLEPNSTSHFRQVQQGMPEPNSTIHFRQVQQGMPEPNTTFHSRPVPPTWSTGDTHTMDLVRKPYSAWTLEGTRRRSPDGNSSTSRCLSPPRNIDGLRQVPPIRPIDPSRSTSFMNVEVMGASRPTSLMTKATAPFEALKPVVRHPPTNGSSPVQTTPYTGEEPLTVASLLHSLGLGKYAILFQAEEVDIAALKQMQETDLRELGIPMGPRKKILLAVMPRARRQLY